MSPSESQLRAALREGAGRGVDADLIIAKAERHRRVRRQRITYAAAAVVVTACVGVGGTLLAHHGSSGDTTGSNDSAAGGAAAASAARSNAPRAASTPAASSPRAGGLAEPKVAACPPPPSRAVVPVGPGVARGPLLPPRVSTITACSYQAGTRAPRSVVLDGVQAQSLATALNHGSVTPTQHPRSCTAADDRGGQVSLLAADANGRRAKTVLVTVRCSRAVATNGAATRYLDPVPPVLNRLVR
ncbi:MAG TPA: hypothetical protein VIG48_00185 [Jatrophihabitans sp.]|jgi:hypothetical protein